MPTEVLPGPRRGHSVLVVDDDAEVRDAVHDGLRREGFTVWPAAHGRAALELLRHQRESIDVVLLDVCMPGLDGPQTLAAIQALTPQIRCCFMSGHLGIYTQQELCRLGADAVFMKPLHLSEVAQVLRTVARRAGASEPRWSAHLRCVHALRQPPTGGRRATR